MEQICIERGLKMTEQRRTICRVLSDSVDHPDVEQVYRRASEILVMAVPVLKKVAIITMTI